LARCKSLPVITPWGSLLMRRIIRKPAVRSKVSYSDTQIWRLEKAGLFLKRIQLTEGGAVGWYEDEIDKWINERARGGGRRPHDPTREDVAGETRS
jgi:prophage regulatory protein